MDWSIHFSVYFIWKYLLLDYYWKALMHPTSTLIHSFNGFAFCNDTPNHSIRHWPVTRATWLSGNQIRNRETRPRLVMADSTRTGSDFKCLGARRSSSRQLDLFHFIGGVHSRSNRAIYMHPRAYLCTNTDLPSSFAAVQITFHAHCRRKASRRE